MDVITTSIQTNRKNIIKSKNYNSFIDEHMDCWKEYQWIEHYYNSYKEHPEIEFFAKPLYFAKLKSFSEFFEDVVIDYENPREGEYYFFWDESRGGQAMFPNSHEWGKNPKTGKQDMKHIYVKPLPFLRDYAENHMCDENDSISFQVNDWGNKYLLSQQNSLIISSRWISLINKEDKYV